MTKDPIHYMKPWLCIAFFFLSIPSFTQPKDSYGRTQAQREWQDYNSHYQQRVQDIQSRPSAYGNVGANTEPFVLYNYKPVPPKPLTAEEKRARDFAIAEAKKEQRKKDSLAKAAEAAWENQVWNLKLNLDNGADTLLSFATREKSWLNAIHFLDSCNDALKRHNDYLSYNKPGFTPFPLIRVAGYYVSLGNLYFENQQYEKAYDYYYYKASIGTTDSLDGKTRDLVDQRLAYYWLITGETNFEVSRNRALFEKNKFLVYYSAYAYLLGKQLDSSFAVLNECLINDYFKGGTDNFNILNSATALLLYQRKDSMALDLYNTFIPQKINNAGKLKEVITGNMALEIATSLQSKRVPVFAMFSLDLLNLLLPQHQKVSEKRYEVFKALGSQRGMRPIDKLWPEKKPVIPKVQELPKPSTMADLVGELELAINMAQTVDLKALRGGVDVPTKILSFGILNLNAPNLQTGLYNSEIRPGHPDRLIDSLYHNQEAIFDKLAAKYQWTKKVDEEKYSKKEAKQNGYAFKKWIFYFDAKKRPIVLIIDCGSCGFNKLEINSYYGRNE